MNRKLLIALSLVSASLVFAADPLYQAKGDHARTYVHPNATEPQPYRIFVPSTWEPGKSMPMVVVLHGGGSNQNTPFERNDNILAKEAEKHGFIVVSPLGGGPSGGYGASYSPVFAPGANRPAPNPGATPDTPARRISESDVMMVTERTAEEYGVDRKRIYLMGNSMGSMGTLYLAQKYQGKWCAIGPSDGPVIPSSYEYDRVTYLSGAIFVHGDHDTLASIDASKEMVQSFKKAGIETKFVEVKDGTHTGSWADVLPGTFDFFDAHRCGR
jgi:predicted peptidase